MNMKNKLIATGLLTLLSITTLAGCTSSQSASISSDPKVVAKEAKKEGKVVSLGMPDPWANWGGSWKDLKTKYNISHTDTDMNSAEAIHKFESEGKKASADITDIGMNVSPTAQKKGILAKYKGEHWDQIPNWAKDKDGYWMNAYKGTIAFITDKKNVSEKDVPKSWSDIKKGKYKVTVGANPASAAQSQYAILAAAHAFGGDESNIKPALNFFSQLQKENRLSSVDTSVQNLKKGEIDVGVLWDFNALTDRHLIDESRYEVTIPQDASVMSGDSQVINKNAKHPYAARFARDYFLSDAGQINIAKGYARPIRDDVKLPADVKAKLLPASAYKKVYTIKDNDVWNKTTLKLGQQWQTEVTK
ncbi:ABC transporter periplasmic protein [Companilactobacillus farciminis KCTC 3681 = DSM 20184]|nr:ABC transporter substrate-binding protein [Companilactobacillus farciminis KCTC 3681 = DSM 20184]KRK62724.1 ABC transporter periplasmic protein [Companilactobacillus farciminis KCTC 3681 = DSM 20184]